MQHISTAFLILTLAIVVNNGATAEFVNFDQSDQVAQESKNRAVTIIDGPKYVAPPAPQTSPNATDHTHKPEQRPPSKPPLNHNRDKHGKPKYNEPRVYYAQIQKLPPLRNHYQKPLKLQHQPNTSYKYHKVVPVQPSRNPFYNKQQPLIFAASTSKPQYLPKSPKFDLPIETINGIRADFVRPPHFANSTSTTTTTTTVATTTAKQLRTKRIWPKHILEKMNAGNKTVGNNTENKTVRNNTTSNNSTSGELQSSPSNTRIIIVNKPEHSPAVESTTRRYQRVTRVSKRKTSSTPAPSKFSTFAPNDWVPIVPSHFTVKKVRRIKQIPLSRRNDVMQKRSDIVLVNPNESNKSTSKKRIYYLQSFGLLPVANPPNSKSAQASTRKNIIFVGKSKKLKPHVYSGSRGKPVLHTSQVIGDYQGDESQPPKIVTRIKHHHHHHHHRYVKTVEKPVRVEVPKPVPVPVPVPMPVKVEHKVPYPVPVQVPHPVPVKVVEKQYVPKPYPVVQHVPVLKHVPVKVPQPVRVEVEKKVPVPYQVEVPRPFPVAVPVEKRVPYPVPVRVMVPQPVPVETRVPYPVEVQVKEPVEVIKHVPVKVPVPQPYPVNVPQPVPVPVETKVPYPVEVEKKVPLPVPFKVPVPQKVEVEKKVPVYVPKPYPVEKKVPFPVRIPFPVRVPIRVPVGIPILVHPSPNDEEGEQIVTSQVTVGDEDVTTTPAPQRHSHYTFWLNDNTENSPSNTVQIHGNTGSGQSSTNSGNSNSDQGYSNSNPGYSSSRPQKHSHYAYSVNGNTVTSSPQNTESIFGNTGSRQTSSGDSNQDSGQSNSNPGYSSSRPQKHSHYSYSVNGNTVTSSPQNTESIFGNTGSRQTSSGHSNSDQGNSNSNPGHVSSKLQKHSHYAYSVNGNTATSSPPNTVPIHGNTGSGLSSNSGHSNSGFGHRNLNPGHSSSGAHSTVSVNTATESHHTVTFHGNTIASTPHHSVTVHGTRGNSKFNGFQSRSDYIEDTTKPYEKSSASPFSTNNYNDKAEVTTISPIITAGTINFEELFADDKLNLDNSNKTDSEIPSTVVSEINTTVDPR